MTAGAPAWECPPPALRAANPAAGAWEPSPFGFCRSLNFKGDFIMPTQCKSKRIMQKCSGLALGGLLALGGPARLGLHRNGA